MYGKNEMQGSLLECLELRIWSLIKSFFFGKLTYVLKAFNRDKFDLMRNVVPTNENKRIQRAWRVNTIDS